jgi:competence protein ComEC
MSFHESGRPAGRRGALRAVLRAGVPVLLLAVLAACDAGPLPTEQDPLNSRSGGKGGPKSDSAIARLSVAPDTLLLAAPGASAQLTVRAETSNGTVVSSSGVAWRSLQPDVAVVDGTGSVTSLSAGTALVTAVSGSVADTAIVIVAVPDTSRIELRFFDVGEGDAVLIRLPDGRAVVYDGGKDRRALLDGLRRLNVPSVDLVIASHGHSDHVGGLTRVLRHYQPGWVMENGLPHTTGRYEEFIQAIADLGTLRLEPTARTLVYGEVKLHIVPPPLIPEWDQNDNSIGVIVEFGVFRASLLGDAEPTLHGWWLTHHRPLFGKVNVHKASHHGSRKGDTMEMLWALRPDVVVVSTAVGSVYPHAEMLAAYNALGARLFRTDVHGTIVLRATSAGHVEVTAEGGDGGLTAALPAQVGGSATAAAGIQS